MLIFFWLGLGSASGITLTPAPAAITTTTGTPVVRFTYRFTSTSASITTSGAAPSVRFTQRYSPISAAIITTVGTPTVTGVEVAVSPPVASLKWRPKKTWETPWVEKQKVGLVFDLEAPASELLILCTSRHPKNTLALILSTKPSALDVKADVDNDIAEAIEILLQI